MRINKYLTDANFCSRREADRLIEAGRVLINGRKARLGDQVEKGDRVAVDGKLVLKSNESKVYIAYHKPVGVITTTDRAAKDNILDRIGYSERIYPIGRLDVKSSGLILLTNDGEIVNRILKGACRIEKEYFVEVDKKISEGFVGAIRSGIELDGRKTLPANVKKVDQRKFLITLVEGRNRQIRRMCDNFGYDVRRLRRFRIGGFTLENLKLKSGAWRELSLAEVEKNLGLNLFHKADGKEKRGHNFTRRVGSDRGHRRQQKTQGKD